MKLYRSAIILLPALACFTACGVKSSSEAETMLSSIQSDIATGHFQQAIATMDSLDRRFPNETAIRAEAIKLRPSAIEGVTIAEIASADSAIAATNKTIDSLAGEFTHIVNPALVENYHVIKSCKKPALMTSTAIEPRVDEDYNFYIVASLQGKNIGLNSLTLTSGGLSATTNVIPEGDERSFASALGQKAVFSEIDAEELGILATKNKGNSATLTFNGRSGSKQITLSPSEVNGIADSYTFAKAHKTLLLAKIRREKLERQLQIARNQIANMSPQSQE